MFTHCVTPGGGIGLPGMIFCRPISISDDLSDCIISCNSQSNIDTALLYLFIYGICCIYDEYVADVGIRETENKQLVNVSTCLKGQHEACAKSIRHPTESTRMCQY